MSTLNKPVLDYEEVQRRRKEDRLARERRWARIKNGPFTPAKSPRKPTKIREFDLSQSPPKFAQVRQLKEKRRHISTPQPISRSLRSNNAKYSSSVRSAMPFIRKKKATVAKDFEWKAKKLEF